MEAHLDAETIERLEEQSDLLLRMYQAEFVKDPASHATGSLRSNMIALRHTIHQIYGEGAAMEFDSPLGIAADAQVLPEASPSALEE